jgi:hypothetical protein
MEETVIVADETVVSQPAAETPPVAAAAEQANNNEFKIPDEYKDKGWARNIKNHDDVYKMLDNSQSMIGKKLGVPDWEKSTPEEIEAFYSKTRPENPDDYTLQDLGEDDSAFFKDLFHKNGISTKQAEALVGGYKQSIDKAIQPLFSADGYKEEMTNRFGDKYEAITNKVADFIKAEASETDRKLLEQLPNNVLGIVNQLIHTTLERHGIKDGDIGGSTAAKTASTEVDFGAYVKEMESLKRRPHEIEDKHAIMRKYGMM